MDASTPLPVIPEAQQTPPVQVLLAHIDRRLEKQRCQGGLVGQLRDEIAVLEGEKARQMCEPSGRTGDRVRYLRWCQRGR
jgi:hypothetical protein